MKHKIAIAIIVLLMISAAYAATRSLVPRADGEGGLGTSAKNWLTAYIDTIFTNVLTFTDSNASPDAVGELLYDNTVANWDDGALCWYDDDEIKYLVDLATLPTNDDYVVAYDAAIDKFYMKADADSGATAWDDITNPDANDEIDFGSYVIELNVENFQIGDGGANYVDFDGTPTITFAGNADIDLPNNSVDLADLATAAYAKDLVTTAPITGAADNIFVGADSDVTIALDFTAAWDFSGTTTIVPWKVNATAAPTVEGQAIWESDTDELTVGDGSISIVIGAKTNTVFAFNIHDIDAGMDDIKMPFTRATTITKVTVFVTGGTNVVGRLYEVDGDGDDADAVGVESSDWTFTTGETEDTSFNNATFDAGDYIQWDTTSVSGSVTGFMIAVEGYEI